MLKKFVLALSATVLLSSCVTDPYTGEKKISKGALYGVIGAGAGAIAGQAAGGDTKSTLIGAASGAALGGGYGYYRDRQEAALRKTLQKTGVGIKREGKNTKLVMPGNITFPIGKTSLKGSFYETLNSVAIVLKKFDKTIVAVNGYTDSTGSDAVNERLSGQRAEAVKDYLAAQGVSPSRLKANGYGSSNPIASNKTSYGREKNRRVEIVLLPIKGAF